MNLALRWLASHELAYFAAVFCLVDLLMLQLKLLHRNGYCY
ncbi:MAG: hypothetical protein QOI01_4629, partial [Mycobacterium sp.]|nr:hypothetical protein [Mycobacterium sp.]